MGELRYFQAFSNNAALFAAPRLVSSESALRTVYTEFTGIDLRRDGFHRHPDASWCLRTITNVSFYFYKLLGMGKIGRPGAYRADFLTVAHDDSCSEVEEDEWSEESEDGDDCDTSFDDRNDNNRGKNAFIAGEASESCETKKKPWRLPEHILHN